ncbi:ankyrin repeat-containing domain protein [Tuber indicum]|nr:ankyrin repeat-containing domain protein [Tuber indicum]
MKHLLVKLFHSRSCKQGRRLLYQLSSQRDVVAVKNLIDRGILDFIDKETLLHRAALLQSADVLETLLNSGLDPNIKDFKRRTVLGLAAKLGRVDLVKILAHRGDVDVNWRDYKSMTPLLLAAQGGHGEIVQILVQGAGADLLVRDASGRNCLHFAALRGCVPIVRFFLNFFDPNGQDYLGWTALHLAAAAGNHLAVRCLLEDERIDANTLNYEGETGLHAAVVSEHILVIWTMVSNPKVEPNIVDLRGQTALHVATSRSSLEIVSLLLSSPRVDVGRVDSAAGNTALHIVAQADNLEGVNLFLEDRRVDANRRNLRGETPLHAAVRSGNAVIVRRLLLHPEVDTNTRVRGETLLHTACRNGYTQVVCVLLFDPRIDVNETTPSGQTPLHLAVEFRRVRIAQLLRQHPQIISALGDVGGETR